MNRIHKFVLTGGPCAGKSSSLIFLSEKLEEIGYKVLTVSETATEIMSSGVKPNVDITMYDFEEELLLGQLEREQVYLRLASRLTHEKVVLLFDRGTMDVSAYCHRKAWEHMLSDHKLKEVNLRDGRYDAVIHLQSVAYDVPHLFTNQNNKHRRETVKEAIENNEKVLNAWIGHPHISIIDNSTNFEEKKMRVLRVILHHLGEPVPLEIEKKYLVNSSFNYHTIPVPYEVIDISQTYLSSNVRVRERGKNGNYIFIETTKKPTNDPKVRIEEERYITGREYDNTINGTKGTLCSLSKKRICFVYRNQYFELDVFEKKDPITKLPLILLEIELTDKQQEVTLPSWIPIIREVTCEEAYTNYCLAKTFD